jgi:hypothetical protein
MKDVGQQNANEPKQANRTENDGFSFLILPLLYFISPMSIVVETSKVSLKIETVVAR